MGSHRLKNREHRNLKMGSINLKMGNVPKIGKYRSMFGLRLEIINNY